MEGKEISLEDLDKEFRKLAQASPSVQIVLTVEKNATDKVLSAVFEQLQKHKLAYVTGKLVPGRR